MWQNLFIKTESQVPQCQNALQPKLQCAKEFTCEVSLKRHVKDIHEKRDSMKEKCQHCNKKITKDNLKKHNESCSRKYFDDSKNKLYMNVLLAEKSGNGTL